MHKLTNCSSLSHSSLHLVQTNNKSITRWHILHIWVELPSLFMSEVSKYCMCEKVLHIVHILHVFSCLLERLGRHVGLRTLTCYYFLPTSTQPQAEILELQVNGCNGISFGDHSILEGDHIPPLKSHGQALEEELFHWCPQWQPWCAGQSPASLLWLSHAMHLLSRWQTDRSCGCWPTWRIYYYDYFY